MIETILKLLPKVGPIIAAAPEFKELVDQLVDTFDDKRDQDDLKAAYALAISDAADAYKALDELVKKRV